MKEWAARRFWTEVDVIRAGDGFGVVLDGRPVRTPAKAALIFPSEDMADRVAGEWRAVDKVIDPNAMPWTRSANSAIDKVFPQRDEVEAHLIGYAETDLTCYRADGPAALKERQAQSWDPMLAWISSRFDVVYHVTEGVMPVSQPRETTERLRHALAPMSVFELTGFHDMVTLSGSFVIAMAAAHEWDTAEALWEASRIDEAYQIEQWGEDAEAADEATLRQYAFLHAVSFFRSAKKTGSYNQLRR